MIDTSIISFLSSVACGSLLEKKKHTYFLIIFYLLNTNIIYLCELLKLNTVIQYTDLLLTEPFNTL